MMRIDLYENFNSLFIPPPLYVSVRTILTKQSHKEKNMRRSASEIISNLENRVARLEKQSRREETLKSLSSTIAKDLSKLSRSRVRSNWVEDALYDFLFDIRYHLFDLPEVTPNDIDFKVLEYRPINLAGTLIVEVKCTMDFPSEFKRPLGFDNYDYEMTFQVIYDHKEIEVKEA
jgi:uncharacterized coiled-coil protein SlyX